MRFVFLFTVLACASPAAVEETPGRDVLPAQASISSCPFEVELDAWRRVEETDGKAHGEVLRAGMSLPVTHIAVCRNGSAAWVRGDDGELLVRFVRANQDAFAELLGARFALETKVGLERVGSPIRLVTSGAGRLHLHLHLPTKAIEIVGERTIHRRP